jgi:type II secretory ATPase GspE/PulE/Tfp pilus assembly ATPase PilB-like protein/CheY-like chemotaxis protein
MLPTPFCQKNNIIPTIDESGTNLFVISNPFDWELLDLLKSSFKLHSYKLALANPNIISSCFSEDILRKEKTQPIRDQQGLEKIILESAASPSESEIAKHPIVAIANSLFHSAVAERASDIHIEPKEEKTIVRFRIDGDMKEAFSIKNKTGIMLISRLKVLANMDIAEKRKPLDGALSAIIDNKTYNIRLATTPTIYGESLIMRLLNAYTKPKDLKELGMTEEQANTLFDLTKRTQGLVLIVGPTGSGKTTTIYSLLNMVDYINRSIVSVEDPVEYRIPFVTQEQVSEKGKASFEALLKSVVRQDPDVLFLGEIRDNYSATTGMNFASTGHLSFTTMHTSSATSAIFRLERLGINRGVMADSIIGIIAQKLLKKLCPHCKEIVSISEEEKKMLRSFTNEIPQKVARPVGCLKCNDTGYYGREGIYETLNFDAEIIEMIRSNSPVSEIRSFVRKRGDYLISDHALEKQKQFIFSPKDVYENALVEEVDFRKPAPKIAAPQTQPGEIEREGKKHVLVVEDDVDTRILINRFLQNGGYITTLAEDGIDALLHMGKSEYDLILSDVEMPNLDGFKLLEMKNQKGIETPVIFLTSKTGHEDEEKGYELGAIDYIKKPIKKEILLLRIKKVIEKQK